MFAETRSAKIFQFEVSLGLLGQLFFLTALHLIVVVDVAALALALRIEESLACVGAFSGEGASTVFMIAVIAHAMGIEWKANMRALCHFALLGARLALLLAG